MKYIILTYESQQDFAARGASEINERTQYWAAWQAYIDALLRAGVVESLHSLLPDYTATTVRRRHGRRHLHDGPYAETSEQVSGYFVIDVFSLDQALEWAEMFPAAASGAVEVRPLMQDCVHASAT